MRSNFLPPLVLFGLLCFIAIHTQAQPLRLTGKVTSAKGEAIPGATIRISPGDFTTLASVEGTFGMNLTPGKYRVEATSVGFEKTFSEFTLSTKNVSVHLKMNVATDELDEALVVGRSEQQRLREQPLSVNVIQTKEFENKTLDINQILDQSTGVRVRETGGMGSDFNFSLNGLSGKQVRFFVDGIPMENLGRTFSLNNFPVNLVDRIEVYKGVVPINLGGDALGGAVNIISRQQVRSFLDAAYSIGSFGTHRASLTAKHRLARNGLTIRGQGFYNRSANNYRMNEMEIYDYAQKQYLRKDITRFHDRYNSAMGQIEMGFTGTSWVDELMLGVGASGLSQEVQNSLDLTPVGEATTEENSQFYTLKARWNELPIKGLSADYYLQYNRLNRTAIDTSSNRYDWSGQIVRRENNLLGELVREKTVFRFEQSSFLHRLNLGYHPGKGQQLRASYVASYVSRQGENRIKIEDDAPFKSPNSLQKQIAGVDYSLSAFDEKLSLLAALKFYHFNMLTRQALVDRFGQTTVEDISTKQGKWGYSAGARYFLLPKLLLKASFEHAYRIPEDREIFGDGYTVMATPGLLPEHSKNLNAGFAYRVDNRMHSFKFQADYFLRDVTDYIFLNVQGKLSFYENLLNVKVRGLEAEAVYTWNKRLSFHVNATLQNVRNNERYIAGTTTESRVYGKRLPNIPYAMGNAGVNYQFPQSSPDKPAFSVYYTTQLINKFYIKYEGISQTATKNFVPTQFLNHAGANVSLSGARYHVGVDVRNLLNARAFDNFMMQKPGRAVYLKLRYFLQ